MKTPDEIVRILDELELYSDDPVKVTRLVGELRFHLARWAGECGAVAREARQLQQQVRELSEDLELGIKT